jgi:hypothetical protein
MRFAAAPVLLTLATFGCRDKTPQAVKIVQFYAVDRMIPTGTKGKLCYGVENAVKLKLDPPADEVYPAVSRCIEISPNQRKTTYSLTAWGADGAKQTKSVEVTAGAPPPRLYDLRADSIDVRRGALVKVCFKVENAQKVKATPGKLDARTNCISDKPRKTTTYKITALGGDKEMDSGTVTVKVH